MIVTDHREQYQDRLVRVRKSPLGEETGGDELLGQGRELNIRHRGEVYRLRLTNANKLILVK